jgi:hypothetical protein
VVRVVSKESRRLVLPRVSCFQSREGKLKSQLIDPVDQMGIASALYSGDLGPETVNP